MAMLENTISPVIDVQRAMRGDRAHPGGGRHQVDDGFGLEVGPSGVELSVPRYVGGIVLLGGVTLFALRMAGFRFSYGARLGGAA